MCFSVLCIHVDNCYLLHDILNVHISLFGTGTKALGIPWFKRILVIEEKDCWGCGLKCDKSPFLDVPP